MKALLCIMYSLVASIIAGMFAALGWPFELFASLLPQLAVISLVVGLLSRFVWGLRRLSFILWVFATIALWGAREQFFAADALVEAPDLRIVWVNMGNDRDENSFSRLMQLARAEQADMVIASEFPERLSEQEVLQETSDYTHIQGKLAGAHTNIVVFSRLPVEAIGSVTERWNSGFLVETLEGSLVVAGVHTPTPLLPENMRRRDEIVFGVADALRAQLQEGSAGILVGDFNAVSWSGLLRSLQEQGAKRVSYGWRSSWQSSLPILGLPIDQLFVFGDAAASVRIGEGIGSDHYPLIVDVATSPN